MKLARFVVLAGIAAVLCSGLALAADGKAVFDSKCAMCHGADGKGKEMWAKQGMKSMADPAWQKSVTDDQLVKTVTDGIPDKKMPAYKEKLSADEIKAVVAHIRTLAK